MSKVFGVYDTVSESFYTVGISTTAGAFAREVGKMLVRVNPNFETETKIVMIADLGDEEVNETQFIDWDIYKAPEMLATPCENPDLQLNPIKTGD